VSPYLQRVGAAPEGQKFNYSVLPLAARKSLIAPAMGLPHSTRNR